MYKILKLTKAFKFCIVTRAARHLSSPAAEYRQTLMNVPPTNVTQIENGIRVASEDSGAATATVGVWIDSGSRYEIAQNNGVAHFLEHMAFKGTSKRSQTDLEMLVDSVGGYLDAYTNREMTAYYMKCLSNDVDTAVEIMADIVQNLKLADGDIERERIVILRQLQDAETNYRDLVFDQLHATAFQGTPLANTVIGPTRNVKRISKADMQKYMSNNYKPPRLVVAAAGGVNHQELVKSTKKHFQCMVDEYSPEYPCPTPCRYTGSEVRIRDDSLPLCHIALAVEGAGWCDADNIPLMVASTYIGSWDRSQGGGGNNASYVARAASEGELSHSFESFNMCYRDTGLWGIYYVCEPMQIQDFTYNIQQEWMKLCNSVTDGEVERARNVLKTNLLLQLDGTTPTCKDIGRQMIWYNRRIPLHELDARIDGCSAQNIRDVCTKYVFDRCPVLAAVGPTEAVPDYNRLRSSMYWIRI